MANYKDSDESIEYGSLTEVITDVSGAVKPPERITITECAEKYRYINNVGSYVGWYNRDITPYMVEVQDMLASTAVTGVAFIASAQSGKTESGLLWMLYSSVADVADITSISPTKNSARDFSIRRWDRILRDCKVFKGKYLDRFKNTFDLRFKAGNILTFTYPSIAELSGRPTPRMCINDYDRIPPDIDGEGSAWALASKRTTTFKNSGCCYAETTPGFLVHTAGWKVSPDRPHEAPPAEGLAEVYNTGDRRRWYWGCVSCATPFIPTFSNMKWDDTLPTGEAAADAYMECPHCATKYTEYGTKDTPSRNDMNIKHARWLPEGISWNVKDNTTSGATIKSNTASFWMPGPAATFMNWEAMVSRYIDAVKIYDTTGNEKPLQVTVNVDHGEWYVPKSIAFKRSAEDIMSTARPLGYRVIPKGVLYLIANIDVQKGYFVVQVHGITKKGDVYVVDRYNISKSYRLDDEGDIRPLDPAAYLEDWKLLVPEVMLKTYKLSDGTGREMSLLRTTIDAAGEAGVYDKAISFAQWLLTHSHEADDDETLYNWRPGLYGRLQLTRGAGGKVAKRVTVDYPEAIKKDKFSAVQGDVTVARLNVQVLKDQVNNMLDRDTDGGGRIHFPDWLPESFYSELTVEVKDPIKGWINPNKARNESWDLLVYMAASMLLPGQRHDRINWSDPPLWATEWDENNLVSLPVSLEDQKEIESTRVKDAKAARLEKLRKLSNKNK